jgi:branched-chain amino acid transport system substrate-binding protein
LAENHKKAGSHIEEEDMFAFVTFQKPRRRAFLLAAGAALLLASGNPVQAELAAGSVYKIGWASDKSNYLSFVDEPLAKGMEIAIDEINAAGGIDGKAKIELDRRDMKSDPMLGATVVQELIAAGANFIVTTCDTDVSLPGAQMSAKAKLPVMSSCGADAAGPSQVPDGYGFLNVPGTLTQGAMLAEYAAKQGYKKAYTLKSKSEGYTHTLAVAFENRFKELGGEIVGEDYYTIGDSSYRVTATKMVNSGADVLMTNTFPPDTTAFLKDLERLGNTTPILLVDGNDTPVIFDAGPQLALATMTTYGGNRTAGSAFEKFEKEYKAKFQTDPESLQTALGYDMVISIAAAVKAAGSFDGAAVRDALDNIENVPGATGLITYKNSPIGRGIPKKDYAIVKFDPEKKAFAVEGVGFPEKFPPVK